MEPDEEPESSAPDESDDTPKKPASWLKRLTWIAASTVVAALAAAGVKWVTDNVDAYHIATTTDVDAIDATARFALKEYLVSRPIQDIGPPPVEANTCNGRYKWAHDQGAVDVSTTSARVTISAKKDHQVQVIGIRRIAVGDRKSPEVGSLLSCPGRGGPPVRHLYLNLDNDEQAYYDGESNQPQEINIPVEGGKTEVLDVMASTDSYDWSYKIQLTLRVDGKDVTKTVDDGGQPFRTTAPTNAKRYEWIDDRWFDTTSGATPPQPKTNVKIPDACTLLSDKEASAVLGESLQVKDHFVPVPANSGSGLVVAASLCTHESPRQDSVQVSLTGTQSEDDAKKEFDYMLSQLDPTNVAQDFAGYSGAKVVGGNLVVMVRGNKILQITIIRQGNKQDPLDAKYLGKLMDITTARM